MLYQIMKSVNNFFEVDSKYGEWVIDGGSINLPFLQEEQYYLIEGSVFNDGVYQYGTESFVNDEKFTGTIKALAVPKSFLDLVKEIEEYEAKNGKLGPYASESFGGYSYTRATGKNGGVATWEDIFRNKLRAYRKL